MAERRPSPRSFITNLLSSLLRNGGGSDQREISAREQLQNGELAVREAMQQLRQRLRREVRGFGGTSTDRTGRSRHINEKARGLLKAYRRAVKRDPRFKLDVELMDDKFRPSPILDKLIPYRREQWQPLLQRSRLEPPAALDLHKFTFIDE
ncbi:hypothetical protein IP88_03955, partial [alpha proteobacterium AAP81b]